MKHVLKIVLKNVDWRDGLLFAWEFFDDKVKAHVAATPKKWDDEALKILDKLIRDLCSKEEIA
jgi:hypothetical protein